MDSHFSVYEKYVLHDLPNLTTACRNAILEQKFREINSSPKNNIENCFHEISFFHHAHVSFAIKKSKYCVK